MSQERRQQILRQSRVEGRGSRIEDGFGYRFGRQTEKCETEKWGSPTFNRGHWRHLQSRVGETSSDALVASLAPTMDAFARATSWAPTLEAEPCRRAIHQPPNNDL